MAGNKITDLDFADDLALLTNDCEQMQLMADSLKNLSKKLVSGLVLTRRKYKRLEILKKMLMYSWKKPHWESFTYLGSIQLNVGDTEKDVRSRIGKVYSVFRRLQTVK